MGVSLYSREDERRVNGYLFVNEIEFFSQCWMRKGTRHLKFNLVDADRCVFT
jgi:hypothetical protein